MGESAVAESSKDVLKRRDRYRSMRRRIVPAGVTIGIAAILLTLVGLITLIVSKESGADRATLQQVSMIAFGGLALVVPFLILSVIAYVNSRCPMCSMWVHPWYFPSEKRHCPHCGETLPSTDEDE